MSSVTYWSAFIEEVMADKNFPERRYPCRPLQAGACPGYFPGKANRFFEDFIGNTMNMVSHAILLFDTILSSQCALYHTILKLFYSLNAVYQNLRHCRWIT
jgi:hypothetical protein